VLDLLNLQTHAELLTLAADVPVGTYTKIRLLINSIKLINVDDLATPEDESASQDVRLPANGKIDLNPRRGIALAAGQTLLIQLDMDANESLHLHETGNGQWRLRPVVFVDITPRGLPPSNRTRNLRHTGNV